MGSHCEWNQQIRHRNAQTSEEIPTENVELFNNTRKPVAKAKTKTKICSEFVDQRACIWKKIDRHWSTTIRSFLFWSVKIHDQNTATWIRNSSRWRRSSKTWRLDREIKGTICSYFAMDSQNLGDFSGTRRRKEEKVSILLESFFIQWILVLPINSRTFKRNFRWSFIARQKNCYRMTSLSTSTTSGALSRRTPLFKVDWSQEGTSNWRDRQSVFFTAVNPIEIQLDQKDVEYDLDKRRIAPYKHTWRAHHNTVCWCNLNLAQRKRLRFCETRSHAITLSDTLPAICIDKSGLHENKGRTLLHNIQVTQVTSRNTCAQLATHSEGCTCIRIERIRWPWEWRFISTRRPVAVTIVSIFESLASAFRCWTSWNKSKRKKFDD